LNFIIPLDKTAHISCHLLLLANHTAPRKITGSPYCGQLHTIYKLKEIFHGRRAGILYKYLNQGSRGGAFG
jgi:hypothetical protein